MNKTAAPWRCGEFDQLQHLALHSDVKRGGRLVRYHQARIAGERHRDQHALPHPAGDFVGIQLQHPPRLGIATSASSSAARSSAPRFDRARWCRSRIAICAPTRFTD